MEGAKEFQKSSYDAEYTLPADFGDYLTFRFFQGPPDLISRTMDDLIASRRPGLMIPHQDGFYIDPSGRAGTDKVNYVQIIFDKTLNPSIGVLALGASQTFEVVGPDIPAPQSLAFVALARPDKRHIRK